MRPWRVLVPALAGLLLGSFVVPPVATAAEGAEEGLVLRYALDEASGATATDASGNARHGAVHGAPDWGGAAEGLGFNGTDTYVELPDNVLAGLDAVTVSLDVRIAPDQGTPYFLYGLGNTSGSNGNGYLFTTGDHYRTSLASGNWSTEQTVRRSTSYKLPRDTWKHLDYTLSGGTAVLYEDGVEVARNANVTLTPGAIGGGTTTANLIGKSLYAADKPFKGRIRDFRIYDRALTPDETAALAVPANTRGVAADTAALDLGDTTAVTTDLALPTTAGGSAVTWASSDPATVSTTGRVTRPAPGRPDARVTLTATVSRGTAPAVSRTKQFAVTVHAEYDDARATAEAARELVVRNVDDVRGNLTLPAEGAYGTTVTWASSDPAVIDPTGIVHRPRHGKGTATVTLTATVARGTARTARALTATVPELPRPQKYTGYAFTYFTGEGTADGEQVRMALSRGNDPLHWRELNGGRPVLTSDLGTKGLRDPFIVRSPEGDKFYQIATDLRMHGGASGSWDQVQRTGSKSIMVWESTDLVNWTDQRLVRVAPDTAGNTWAPEAYYDETIGAYVVFWASKLYAANDPDHTGTTYNKMLYATTRDFHTFSEPKVWNDPGYSVIDSTVIRHDGTHYRFTKDERNTSSTTPCSKFITAEKATDLRSTTYDFVADCIGKGTINQGEGPTVFKSNTEDKWYLFIDEFGGRGYVPFETTDLASGTWTPSENYALPSSPRHGTVVPVTQAEYDRLLAAYATGPAITAPTGR
ncbi:immunoglobulin-like domain-containing protein [Streptomyces sp. TRM64462]|uniref:immunoglobulin-like domain-containing protein n=1 Tax=Streptomyces sp. TRM64462 TaxID=2741726 RepID=UPI001586AB0B